MELNRMDINVFMQNGYVSSYRKDINVACWLGLDGGGAGVNIELTLDSKRADMNDDIGWIQMLILHGYIC